MYSSSDIKKALKKTGIKKGDTIFLSTSLGLLGKPNIKNLKNINQICEFIYKAVNNFIGKEGNILVPTYSYSIGKGEIFKHQKTQPAKSIGPFARFFLKQKNIIRSIDPMISVAGKGPLVNKLLSSIPHTSYGKDCIFERLNSIKKSKCCSIGLGYNMVPFLHYLDWKNKVPFRYDKYFKGKILINKKICKVIWHYPVRYRKKSAFSDGYKLGKKALEKKILKEFKLGSGMVYSCDYKKYVKFANKEVKKDPWLTASGKL